MIEVKEQSGDTWYLGDGRQVAREFLRPLDKLNERQVSRAFKEAVKAAKSLQKTRETVIDSFKKLIEAITEGADKKQSRYTAYNFSRSLKLEMDVKDLADISKNTFRFYVATKENPSYEDYSLLPLNINATTQEPETTEKVAPKEDEDTKEENTDRGDNPDRDPEETADGPDELQMPDEPSEEEYFNPDEPPFGYPELPERSGDQKEQLHTGDS